jgi:SET domain-containing protein 6
MRIDLAALKAASADLAGDVASEEPWVGTCVALMHEFALGAGSRWGPYLRLLPGSFNTPVMWPEGEAEALLAGTGLLGRIGRDAVESCWNEVVRPAVEAHPRMFGLDGVADAAALERMRTLFLRCGSIINAYSFTREDDTFIAPMADMLNHKTVEHNAQLWDEGDDEALDGGDLIFRAIRPIAAGEEIYNTYGELSDAELLRKYGFIDSATPTSNPFNDTEVDAAPLLAAAKGKTPKQRKERLKLLQEAELLEDPEDPVVVVPADGNPAELLVIAYLAGPATDEAVARLKAAGLRGALREARECQEAVRAVRAVLEHRRREMEHEHKAQGADAGKEAERVRLAAWVVDGERAIVQLALDRLEVHDSEPEDEGEEDEGKESGESGESGEGGEGDGGEPPAKRPKKN